MRLISLARAPKTPPPAICPTLTTNGYNGWRIDQIDAQIVAWMKKEKPAVVLLHLGTNDAIQNYAFSAISTRLSNLITDITTESPQTHVIVAKIIRSTDAGTESRVETFNNSVDAVVAAHAANKELVTMVDMYSAVSTSQLSVGDPYHPNRAGYDAMGDAWFKAIQSLGAIHNPVETPEPGTAALGISGLLLLGLCMLRQAFSIMTR